MIKAYPTVYVVGDSTVSSFDDKYYLPRYGYGTQLGRYFKEGVKVVNLALSGRSSKSFLSEPNYARLRADLSHGDFLVIGFGHNDEKREEERYTNPNTPYTEEDTSRGLSFRHNLYKNYICLARDRGATPILCTPIVRLSEEDDYSGTCGHITQTGGGFEGGDYPAAIRKLGQAVGVTVVDLTASSMARYLKVGHKRAAEFHAWAGTSHGVPAGLDGTHLNKYGAAWTAYEWAVALSQSDDPLKNYLKDDLIPPAEGELEQAINRNYSEPQYVPFNGDMAGKLHFKLPAPWYATVMGDFGGVEHIPEFTVEGEGGNIKLGNLSVVPRGKISSKTDGFAAAFVQLPAGQNFTASVRCRVLKFGDGADGQTAFGMMLRDDIYADQYVPSLNSNYIAAAIADGRAVFCREGGMLKREENAVSMAAGATFELTITKVNQQIRAQVNGFSRTWYDFDLAASDGASDYLCLFACRHVEVQFSQFTFKDLGSSARA